MLMLPRLSARYLHFKSTTMLNWGGGGSNEHGALTLIHV